MMRLTIINQNDDGSLELECSCGMLGVFNLKDVKVGPNSHVWYFCTGCSSEYNINKVREENKEAFLVPSK